MLLTWFELEEIAAAREQIEVDAAQQVAGAHAIAFAHVHREPLAAQCHGVHAYVRQQLRAAGRAQRDGVARRRDGNHFAIAGRAQLMAGRIDGRAISQHGAREHFIGDLRERTAPAGEWRANLQGHVISR